MPTLLWAVGSIAILAAPPRAPGIHPGPAAQHPFFIVARRLAPEPSEGAPAGTPSEPAPGEPPPSEPRPSEAPPGEPPEPTQPPAAAESQPIERAPPEAPPRAPPTPHAPKPVEEPVDDDYRISRSRRPNIAGQPVSVAWDPELIINTDRPDFTDVLPSVPKRMWQTESGYSFKHRFTKDGSHDRHQAPETLVRLGLTDRVELRLRWDSYMYTRREGIDAAQSGPQYGSDLLVGFKWQAVKQARWRPAHTILGTLVYRMGSGGLAGTAIQPGLNWVYGWQVNKWLVVRGSTGVETIVGLPQRRRDGAPNDLEPVSTRTILELHQSAVAYWQVVKRLGVYTEWFSFYDFAAVRAMQQNAGLGLYIYITPDVQIDLRGGGAFAGTPHEIFTGAGLSLRGDYRKKRRTRRDPRAE